MRIGVVGSRDWKDEAQVRALVASLPIIYGDDFTLVSGGAYRRTKEFLAKNPGTPIEGGVDYWAELQAQEAGFKMDIMHAQWSMYGKIAGMLRNQDLVDSCDKVYIFWDGKSPGSRHLIKYCKKQKKDFEVISSAV